jgi:GNAT superfamily N-acetyltransferase
MSTHLEYHPCARSAENDHGDTLLEVFTKDGKVAASALLRESLSENGGQHLEKMHVVPEHRGKGLARMLLQEAKKRATKDLYIKPRPFGDMPATIDALKKLYRSEGFKGIDDKDNMVFKKTASSGTYNGKFSDPESVKFTRDFQGLTVKVDRPKGFIMSGKSPEGKDWTRTYQYDYGFIPDTLGGDGDGIDVYLGPDKEAKTAYWVVQHKPDGGFDEYKVFLGFEDEDAAKQAYKQHAPAELMGDVSAMSIEMMKAMLGKEDPQETIEKTSMWCGFVRELSAIEAP